MSDLVLHHATAARAPAAGAWRQFTTSLRQVWLGLREGLEAAHRYERLAAASDAELARLGISREDVPWFAMYGKPRPRRARGPETRRSRFDDPPKRAGNRSASIHE